MKTTNPLRKLPARLRRHARTPLLALAAWGVCLALLLTFFATRASFGSTGDEGWTSKSDGRITVRVSGSLDISPGDGSVEGDDLGDLSLRSETGGELQLVDSKGRPRYRYVPTTADEATLQGPNGPAYQVRHGQEGAKLVLSGASGGVLFRVKVKADKFNLYDSTDRRFAKGKRKDGAIVVRSEPDGADIGRITGASSLGEAGILSLPIPAPYRVLLWASRTQL